ncbi:putative membrane protein [Propionispora sp. 2/2-37]|uniref:germination protein YpeB n=1 Tax=Propionispora sp. 2/2-37 TaxID=1677858 RepID=UPI0006BB68E6|nr:germination protein YpeB [Propionispora sp. 2/2-37]CUH97204.1 putative membrane protein [Propionispora sp. 2/2-37]
MRKRWLILGAIGALVLVAVLGWWGYRQYQTNRSLETFLNNKYQRAFFEMTSQVQNLEVLFAKSVIVTDPSLAIMLLMDIRQQAAFAQANLGQLPLNDMLAGRTARFLAQAGEYGNSLSREILQGGVIEAKHRETLNSLYQQSAELNRELQGVQARVAQNNSYFGAFFEEVRNNLQKTPDNIVQTDFAALDKQMQRYPTLVYDGPFSEHLERVEPKNLSGMAEIQPEEAQNKALAFIEKSPGVNYAAVVTGMTNGRIPAHRVEVTPEGDSEQKTVLDISQKGGKAIWMFNSRPIGEPNVSIDQARQNALQFLHDRGFGEMSPTYYLRQGNSVMFNFAAVQKNVILYPDLVKVTVALDNGGIIGTEATGYLMSHGQRDLPEPKVSKEQAQSAINPSLVVSGGRLVLIPAGVTGEKLAYEFPAKLGEDNYLVYVNALTGREENVLRLIETSDGTLTM